MTKKALIILLLFTLFLAAAVYYSTDNTADAEIHIAQSEIFSQEELLKGAKIILTKFRIFPAELYNLRYKDEFSLAEWEYWTNQYSADEVLVFKSDFRTFSGSRALNSGFEPDMKYESWMWVLVRNNGGRWQLKTWGY